MRRYYIFAVLIAGSLNAKEVPNYASWVHLMWQVENLQDVEGVAFIALNGTLGPMNDLQFDYGNPIPKYRTTEIIREALSEAARVRDKTCTPQRAAYNRFTRRLDDRERERLVSWLERVKSNYWSDCK